MASVKVRIYIYVGLHKASQLSWFPCIILLRIVRNDLVLIMIKRSNDLMKWLISFHVPLLHKTRNILSCLESLCIFILGGGPVLANQIIWKSGVFDRKLKGGHSLFLLEICILEAQNDTTWLF